MSNGSHFQGPETQGLLADDNEPTASSYQDEPDRDPQRPDLNMGLASQAAARESDVELESPKDPNPMVLKPEARAGDSLGLGLVVGGSALLVVLTWITVLSNDPKSLGLFAYHPPLQTLAIALFAIGILTLQPTSQPRTKAAGLTRHQLIILGLAFPCIAVGTLIIIWNKKIHEAPHFTSWHGTFGIIAIAWMFVQMALGAGSVWFNGAAFGGGAKAKAVWKYHRLSGYVLFPFFLATAHIGGAWSDWMLMSTSQVTRIFGYVIAPLAIIVGLWSRARLSKMKFF